ASLSREAIPGLRPFVEAFAGPEAAAESGFRLRCHLLTARLHAGDVILVGRARAEARENGKHVGHPLGLGVLLAGSLGGLKHVAGCLRLGRPLTHEREVARRGLSIATTREPCREQTCGESSISD